jgi:hypothetical protein
MPSLAFGCRLAAGLTGIFGLLLGGQPVAAAEGTVSKEYQVKAAFLYNFTKFVEWPAQHFATEDRPVVIAVLGHNPFGEELEQITRGRRVNGREITIAFIDTPAAAAAADLVFVCAGEESRFEAMNTALRQAQVLTIGESPRFADAGGIITFLREADKVHFVINLESAERAGLKISAQLLKLATEVQRKSKPP